MVCRLFGKPTDLPSRRNDGFELRSRRHDADIRSTQRRAPDPTDPLLDTRRGPGSTRELTMDPSRQIRLFDSLRFFADLLGNNCETIDLTDRLMQCCLEVLDVVAVGLVVDEYPDVLGILSRSPNNTAIMERLRLDDTSGPCHEVFSTGGALECTTVAEMRDRWPTFVPIIQGRGVASVLALPLRYRNETVGALALFCDARGLHDPEQQLVARGLADLATMAVINRRQLTTSSPGTDWRQTIDIDRPAAVSLV